MEQNNPTPDYRTEGNKLTATQVAKIKRAILDGVKGQALADQYRVSATIISHIKSGVYWRRVPPEGGWPEGGWPKTGRAQRIENANRRNAWLTESEVLVIKKKIRAGAGNSELAQQYHVTPQAIAGIRNGQTWRHVLLPGEVLPPLRKKAHGRPRIHPEPPPAAAVVAEEPVEETICFAELPDDVLFDFEAYAIATATI